MDWNLLRSATGLTGAEDWISNYISEVQATRDREVRDALTLAVDILDELDRVLALASEADRDAELGKSIEVLRARTRQRLHDFGLRPVPTLGVGVDPNMHEVLEVVSGEAPPETIVREVRAGYFYQDRLLRPAIVVSIESTPSC